MWFIASEPTQTFLLTPAYHVLVGWGEDSSSREGMLCFKSDRIDVIYTYAKQAAQWLCEEGSRTMVE